MARDLHASGQPITYNALQGLLHIILNIGASSRWRWQIMTIHKAKGLEFILLLSHLEQSTWISNRPLLTSFVNYASDFHLLMHTHPAIDPRKHRYITIYAIKINVRVNLGKLSACITLHLPVQTTVTSY